MWATSDTSIASRLEAEVDVAERSGVRRRRGADADERGDEGREGKPPHGS